MRLDPDGPVDRPLESPGSRGRSQDAVPGSEPASPQSREPAELEALRMGLSPEIAAAGVSPPTLAFDGIAFIEVARRMDVCRELSSNRVVVARLPEAPPAPGGLRQMIEDAVEGALANRGALPPGVAVGAELAASVRDQLLRIQALGARGLAIVLPRFCEGRMPQTRLTPEDSRTLGMWIDATRGAPVVILFGEEDRRLEIHCVRPVEELSTPAPQPKGKAAPAPPRRPAAIGEARAPALERVRAPQAHESRAHAAERAVVEATPEPEPTAHSVEREVAPASSDASDDDETLRIELFVAPAEEPAAAPAPIPTAPERAARVVAGAEWRAFAVELDAACGPKPVSVIEKLFAQRYMPLLGAATCGEVDAAVRGVLDAWRTSFEHSYRDSFAALRVTGKRPAMVLDAPEIAARIGRLNGARTVKLLLVDAMRFDLGERLTTRLSHAAAGRAVCIERPLLWSALPTTTPVQLALLARGPEALKDPAPTGEREPDIARGRAISTLRRERIGSREVMKLDLVEARLRAQGPALDERLDTLADEIAPIVGRYLEGLAPRTLLFVFGDHGFRMLNGPDFQSTAPATQGGASPEEVLVPAYAWLVDGVH